MGGNSRLSIILVVLLLVGASVGKILEDGGTSAIRRSAEYLPKGAPAAVPWLLPRRPQANLPDGRVRHRDKRPGRSSTGTAFSVGSGNLWITARHVIDGCTTVASLTAAGRLRPRSAYRTRAIHPSADVAVLSNPDSGPRPFQLAGSADGILEAFHVGYPQGKPSAVHSRYLGARRLSHGAASGRSEVVRVWAEQRRSPEFSGSLGGISGGPVFDNTGAVIGITIAGNPRRGRISTSSLRNIFETAKLSGQEVRPAPAKRRSVKDLTAKRFPIYAQKLLKSHRVERLLCLVAF